LIGYFSPAASTVRRRPAAARGSPASGGLVARRTAAGERSAVQSATVGAASRHSQELGTTQAHRDLPFGDCGELHSSRRRSAVFGPGLPLGNFAGMAAGTASATEKAAASICRRDSCSSGGLSLHAGLFGDSSLLADKGKPAATYTALYRRNHSPAGRGLSLHAGSIGDPSRLASTHGATTAPTGLHRISRQPAGLFHGDFAADPALMATGTASAATPLPYANSFGGRSAAARACCSDCTTMESAFLDSSAAGLLSTRNPSRSSRQPAILSKPNADPSGMGTAQAYRYWGVWDFRGWGLDIFRTGSTAVWPARLASECSSFMATAALNADHSSRRFGHSGRRALCPGFNADPSPLADTGAFTAAASPLLHRAIHSDRGQSAVRLEGSAPEYLARLAAGAAFTKAQAALRDRAARKQSTLRSTRSVPEHLAGLADNAGHQTKTAAIHNRSSGYCRQPALYLAGSAFDYPALLDHAGRDPLTRLFAADFSGNLYPRTGTRTGTNPNRAADTGAAPLPLDAPRAFGDLRRNGDGLGAIRRHDLGGRDGNSRGFSEHSLGTFGELRRDRDGFWTLRRDDLGRRDGLCGGISNHAARTQRGVWLGINRHGLKSLRGYTVEAVIK
jgi:hypothetical protein